MTVSVRGAEEADVPALARMNQELVEDQGSRNPFTRDQYERRFSEWLASNWEVDLFLQGRATLGYGVHQIRADQYFPDQRVVYLRQFYIKRELRRRGLGAAAFAALQASRFGGIDTISLDVLATNPAGQAFWRHLGFQPYYINMKQEQTA